MKKMVMVVMVAAMVIFSSVNVKAMNTSMDAGKAESFEIYTVVSTQDDIMTYEKDGNFYDESFEGMTRKEENAKIIVFKDGKYFGVF